MDKYYWFHYSGPSGLDAKLHQINEQIKDLEIERNALVLYIADHANIDKKYYQKKLQSDLNEIQSTKLKYCWKTNSTYKHT